MKKQLLFAFGAAALLASCSNDIDSPKVNDGYLRVNASIEGVNTRAGETSFDDNDEIGVSASGASLEFTKFTYNNTNFTSGSPIKLTEKTDFVAYYPYQAGATESISFDLTTAQDCDFLFATASAEPSNPTANFTFAHKMSRLAIKIVDGTESLSDYTPSIVLKNIGAKGSFSLSDGSVTVNSNADVAMPSAAFDAISTQIVPPYASTQTTPTSIQVVVTVNDVNYVGNIVPKLEVGQQYTYTLTIKGKTQADAKLDVSGGITGWGTEAGDTESDLEKQYVLSVGDFLLKSGKTVAPTTANAKIENDPVIGIVYYVGNSLPSQVTGYEKESNDYLFIDFYKKLGNEEIDWTKHGLALAVKNYGNATVALSKNEYEFNAAAETSNWFNTNSSNYLPLITAKASGLNKEYLKGYHNTYFIKTLQANDSQCGFTDNLISYLSSFNSEKPQNCSDWFVPSIAELMIWQEKFSDLNTSLNILEGSEALEQFEDFVNNAADDKFYWSSDLATYKMAWTSSLKEESFTDGNRAYTKSRKGYLRFSIAF